MQGDSGWIGSWSPGVGDPSVVGWLITLGYLWVGWQCRTLARNATESQPVSVRVVSGARQISRQSGSGLPARERAFFQTLSWVLICLGLNKQLDLQTPLLAIGALTARELGLLELSVALKLGFLLVVAVTLAAIGGMLWRRAKNLGPAVRLAAFGILLLLVFFFVRALTFERVGEDSWLRMLLFDSGVVEGSGLLCVALAVRKRRKLVAARPRS